MERVSLPLSKIYPWPDNPRTHPPAQVALLAELIKRYGPDQDIVVDEDGVILKGHGRLLAATLAGLREFPVTRRTGLSEADKTAMRIQDNQVALLSGWDRDLLRGQIGALRADGFDVKLLGFGDTQLVQFETLPGPPGEFPAFGEDIPTAFCCPKCGYKWSGSAAPGKATDDE
jgi:ParB-like chromosome segregation protein Spo0J